MSTRELLVAYGRERLRPGIFVPLSFALAFVGWYLAPAAGFHASAFLRSTIEAFVLCVAFRVVDDLQDRELDRTRHPGRVMSRAPGRRPFVALAMVLLAGDVCAWLMEPGPWPRIASIALCGAGLAAWYAVRPSEKSHSAFGECIVVLKYPLIAYAIAPAAAPDPLSARTIVILVALYVLVCAGALVDDPELRPMFLSRRPIP